MSAAAVATPRLPAVRGVAATPDPIAGLAAEMADVCTRAVDVDEVAAVLEASGINDRLATRDYDMPSVFALAAAVLAHSGTYAEMPPPETAEAPALRPMVVPTLVRSLLYLTPTAVALGAARQVGGVSVMATVGTLVFGWGAAQVLAFLGYRALGERGPVAACRVLGVGFAALSAIWLTSVCGSLREYAVSGVQLALFAATAAALVTGAERRVLACALPIWAAAGALAFGAGDLAPLALIGAVALVVVVAYRPAFARSGRWYRPTPRDVLGGLSHGCVGTGQAVLFVLVVLAGSTATRLPIEALPLLAGVPMTELALLWHQRRVAGGRDALDDRAAFRRHLRAASWGTLAVLAVPTVAGAYLATAGTSRLASTVELTAAYALCLVLVAHRRIGTAAILMWWPAALIAVADTYLGRYAQVSQAFLGRVGAAILLAVCLPALGMAAVAMRDPWSYR
jgi:hypothetical protein